MPAKRLGAARVVGSAGSAEKGESKSTACIACHGPGGNSVNPEWPSLAGQGQAYIHKHGSDAHYLWMGRMATVFGIALSVVTAYATTQFNNIMDMLQLVFAFVNAMVSGDVNDNRLLWMLLSAGWVIPRATASPRPTAPAAGKKSPLPATHR